MMTESTEKTANAEPEPRQLADLDRVLADAQPSESGAVWRLAEQGRQVDANLVRLRPAENIDTHQEHDVDVLVLMVEGRGTLHTDSGSIPLVPHALLWLPRGSRRAIEAGPEGLAYLTVHRTRTGLTIRPLGDRRTRV